MVLPVNHLQPTGTQCQQAETEAKLECRVVCCVDTSVVIDKSVQNTTKITVTRVQSTAFNVFRILVVALFPVTLPVLALLYQVSHFGKDLVHNLLHPHFQATRTLSTTDSSKLPIIDSDTLWATLEGDKVISQVAEKQSIYLKERDEFRDILPMKGHIVKGSSPLNACWMGETGNSPVLSQHPGFKRTRSMWEAIAENSMRIVDLSRTSDPVTPYYPAEVNGEKKFPLGTGTSSLTITLVKKTKSSTSDSTLFEYTYDHPQKGKSTIQRIHFAAWTDHAATALEPFLNLCEEFSSENKLWIHCRAGVGRSGTLLGALRIREGITAGTITRDNLREKIRDIVNNLREHRSPLCVQTPSQLKLLVQAGQYMLARKEAGMDDLSKYESHPNILARLPEGHPMATAG